METETSGISEDCVMDERGECDSWLELRRRTRVECVSGNRTLGMGLLVESVSVLHVEVLLCICPA